MITRRGFRAKQRLIRGGLHRIPAGKLLAVFDVAADADRAVEGLRALRVADVERFEGAADADRFDATGQRHGPMARVLRTVQSA